MEKKQLRNDKIKTIIVIFDSICGLCKSKGTKRLFILFILFRK